MIRRRVGFVPGDRKTEGLVLDMSGLANITLPIVRQFSRFGLVSVGREQLAARAAAARGGVKGDLTALVRALSGGNQQKVRAGHGGALVSAATQPADPGRRCRLEGRDLRADPAHLRRRGGGALVVSREIVELQGLCDPSW